MDRYICFLQQITDCSIRRILLSRLIMSVLLRRVVNVLVNGGIKI